MKTFGLEEYPTEIRNIIEELSAEVDEDRITIHEKNPFGSHFVVKHPVDFNKLWELFSGPFEVSSYSFINYSYRLSLKYNDCPSNWKESPTFNEDSFMFVVLKYKRKFYKISFREYKYSKEFSETIVNYIELGYNVSQIEEFIKESKQKVIQNVNQETGNDFTG